MERYFRLTPMLACVILYYSTLLIHQGQGPIWYTMFREEEKCKQNWWAGFLHVTNYIDPKCAGHSYYIAMDFQFYLLSPLFLLPLHRKPKIGFLLLATASLVSSLAATVNSYVKNIGTGNKFIHYVRDRNTETDDGSNYFGIHYRIPSFTMGLALGYFLFQVNIKKHDFIPSKVFIMAPPRGGLLLLGTIRGPVPPVVGIALTGKTKLKYEGTIPSWCEDAPLASESRNRPQSPQQLSNNVYTSSIFKYGHTRIKKILTYRVAVTSQARDSTTSQVVTQGSEVRVLLTVSEAHSRPRVQSVPLNVQARAVYLTYIPERKPEPSSKI
ncbi:hypothetical protein J6590_064681 [Homalodisca vitripennis]|nr:hypothetical protein J6590_064681 [Homalodisca vitripennis]